MQMNDPEQLAILCQTGVYPYDRVDNSEQKD